MLAISLSINRFAKIRMLREAEMAYYPFPARKHCSDHHKAKVSGATQKVLPLVTYRNLRGIEYIEAIRYALGRFVAIALCALMRECEQLGSLLDCKTLIVYHSAIGFFRRRILKVIHKLGKRFHFGAS